MWIGTSGWQYRHWRPGFYAGVPSRRWLAHYTEHFATVELNGSFYRLPDRSRFELWAGGLPEGFLMAVKMSRYLTHVRRLASPAEPVRRFMDAVSGLGDHLGPILLQLPPTLPADAGLLAGCLAEFARFPAPGAPGPGRDPAGRLRIAVEPRHPSWWTAQIRDVLTAHGAALCWADRRGRPAGPLWRTADGGYLRFHEGTAQPWPRYGRQALRSWAGRLAETWPGEADVYVYFNNDPGGAAVADSIAFGRLAARAGLTVTRTPGRQG